MKAKNSNPELKYNLNEGKHKKTLLEKYLNEWTGNERSNGSVNLAEPSSAPKFIQKNSNNTKKKTSQQYKDFLNNFDKLNSENNLLELDSLIKSKS